jgi:hypothetical protein
MEKELIQSLLSQVFNQLNAESAGERKSLDEGIGQIAQALRLQDIDTVFPEKLSVQSADFYFQSRIPKAQINKIDKIAEEVVSKEVKELDTRIFVREAPIRSSQVVGSVPKWAQGAKVEKTIGPISRVDGRKVFVDVFKVVKLVALRKQGTNVPLILFKAEFSDSQFQTINPAPVEVTMTYKVVAGTVWIKADLLAANAPADRYVGLQVNSGEIKLSALPTLQGQQLIVANSTSVTTQLNLLKTVPNSGAKKKHGRDALDSSLSCPETFSFIFGGVSINKITAAGTASWSVYGRQGTFSYQVNKTATYSAQLGRVLIPYGYSESNFSVAKIASPWMNLEGTAQIKQSWWGIPAAELDVNAPLEAAGSGGMVQDLNAGLKASWKGMEGNPLVLGESQILLDPGRIGITALQGSSVDSFQKFDFWKDRLNSHGTSLSLRFPSQLTFIYNSLIEGTEVLITNCHAEAAVDRPKLVNGHAVEVKSKNSILLLGASDKSNLIYVLDDNMLWDNKLPFDKVPKFKNQALALENALFTVSPANGLLIFGTCDPEWKKITDSQTFLIFGLMSYLPTLPDPYLANFGIFGRLAASKGSLDKIQNWLFCRIIQKAIPEKLDEVLVSFHFGQGNAQATAGVGAATAQPVNVADMVTPEQRIGVLNAKSRKITKDVPDYEQVHDNVTRLIDSDFFALLDVSSNANQVGVSMGMNPMSRQPGRQTTGFAHRVSDDQVAIKPANGEVISVEGMQVKVPGHFARIFLMPQVAWEPVYNTAIKVQPMDPPPFFNYYPNDGGPTRLLNTNSDRVTLAPIPLTSFLIEKFQQQKSEVLAQFTLPFGLKALARLDHGPDYKGKKPKMEHNSPAFPNELAGGIQIRAIGGDAGAVWPQEPHLNDQPMFEGFTTQLNNILDLFGNPTGASTLGDSVTRIFNGEFSPAGVDPKGVPVSYIDFTGYGASTFSNWLSPSAAIAQTSQSRFDIMLGRTSHEVIQVKSLIYPWGIRVVRTITLFRASSGFVYRMDSGWQAETDGRFDFRYKYKVNGASTEKTPYKIHPGTLRGLFNIQNIQEDANIADFERSDDIKNGDLYINSDGDQVPWTNGNSKIPIFCRPVWFDADVELENLVQGHKNNRTPAKKILGYVQLAPSGVPLSPERFKELLNTQGGLIGGDLDCVMDLNKSGQLMRVTRFDFSHAKKKNSTEPVFVGATRGSVILPKTGSWSIVQHSVGTGDVTPLPNHIPVPIIRQGEWTPSFFTVPLDKPKVLLRMASPSEILVDPSTQTINFGILQTTATQKVLMLTPSFDKGVKKLLSKTPPLFADAYSLMSGNSIFPNAGNAIDEFGKAFPMLTGTGSGLNKAKAFLERADLKDLGSNVMELLSIEVQKQGEAIVDQGFKLLAGKANEGLNKALAFDLPPFKTYLVDMEALKIYIKYVTKKKESDGNSEDGKLNFDIDSFASEAAKTWKSRLNNLTMVVDLGSFEGLMKIKGNFDAQKGKESGYEGDKDPDFPTLGYPTPEIEFHDALQPVIDILQVLASLNQGKYADVMKKGLEIAMSNAGEIWEYKFEAKKEIPLVRFPPEENLYNAPTTPLKLEAGLELGVYFNAALKVTSDPKQLLPTAGAYIQFQGGLEVMCASVAVGTVYAVGEVILKVACDTKIGPSLSMKFGFGVSIAVGLPVIGTVSVTYIVGCEMYASLEKITLTAYLLFKGRASLVGGLVSITIYIEASGSVERKFLGTPQERTDCTATVTFGLDISICFVINISFEETWQEGRQIA